MDTEQNVLMWGLYDSPLWRDPLAWLLAISIVAAVGPVLKQDRGSGHTAALITDLVFAVAFQWVLFGVIPARIRLYIRDRRE